MSPNTLPNQLTCCLQAGSEHERRTNAEKWIAQTLKNCDVVETRADYTCQMLPNIAVFKLKGKP